MQATAGHTLPGDNMLRMLETLWATAPDWNPIPYTEDDSDPTEECEPPTLPSVLSPEAAYEMAMAAMSERRYEAAKGYLQYYNVKTRGL